MAFEQKWEETHTQRAWGKYPSEEIVRFSSKELRKGQSVLDLGAGQGAATWFLAREGFNPVAIDGSISAIRKARARLTIEGFKFQGVTGCLTKLPFADKSFDAAVDVVSVAHNAFDDVYGIFKEVARVLKTGGKLFSVLPTNKCSRRPFNGFTTTFLERDEVNYMLHEDFANVQILNSSYQLSLDCRVDTWVVTGERQPLMA